jgi:methionine biosynthesis protein MetW
MNNHRIDIPGKDDNRQYDYSHNQSQNRAEYDYITQLVSSNSSVIDLGCGNGSLLKKLVEEKKVIAQGIEISSSGVEACKHKGLKVLQSRIDEKLPFRDLEFNFSICNVTIQMVMYPEVLLREMKRISKYQIISFPNFAFYKNRIDLLFNGRMPKAMLFDYKWYNTGHIHQFSISDFYELLNDVGGIKVEQLLWAKTNNKIKDYLSKSFPDLFMAIPIFYLSNKDA